MPPDGLPEGAVEAGAIGVTQYFDTDGELHYWVSTTGELPLSSYVGLLELGKHTLIERAEADWEPD